MTCMCGPGTGLGRVDVSLKYQKTPLKIIRLLLLWPGVSIGQCTDSGVRLRVERERQRVERERE